MLLVQGLNSHSKACAKRRGPAISALPSAPSCPHAAETDLLNKALRINATYPVPANLAREFISSLAPRKLPNNRELLSSAEVSESSILPLWTQRCEIAVYGTASWPRKFAGMTITRTYLYPTGSEYRFDEATIARIPASERYLSGPAFCLPSGITVTFPTSVFNSRQFFIYPSAAAPAPTIRIERSLERLDWKKKLFCCLTLQRWKDACRAYSLHREMDQVTARERVWGQLAVRIEDKFARTLASTGHLHLHHDKRRQQFTLVNRSFQSVVLLLASRS